MSKSDTKKMKTKERVSKYLEENLKPGEDFFPQRVAYDLNLDIFEVYRVLEELEKEKEIGWL